MQPKISPFEKRQGARFFYNIFDADPGYMSALEIFLSNHGSTQTRENPILMLYYGIGGVVKP